MAVCLLLPWVQEKGSAGSKPGIASKLKHCVQGTIINAGVRVLQTLSFLMINNGYDLGYPFSWSYEPSESMLLAALFPIGKACAGGISVSCFDAGANFHHQSCCTIS